MDHNRKLQPDDGLFLSDECIKSTFMQITFAGVTTTTFTMYESIFAMIHHPECKERIHQEIEEVLGSRRVRLDDRGNMPYVNAFINEVLRYHNLAPINLPHMTICDVDLQGYHVPKGTIVYANLSSLHTDKAFWVDPSAFRPERFLDDNGPICASRCRCQTSFDDIWQWA